MKKLTALLLALLLVLSGTLALAEESAMAFPSITLTDEIDINRDAAKTILAAMELQDDQIEFVDSVLAILSAVNERLTIADGGIQLDIGLNGDDVFSIGGELTDDGLAIASTLFPSYVLTVSAETIMKALEGLTSTMSPDGAEASLPAEAMAAIQEYANQFIDAVKPAIGIGEVEVGEFTFEDMTFNTMVPIHVDTVTIAQAAKTFMEQVNSDETITAALESMSKLGIDTSAELNLPEELSEENVPAVSITAYANVDENGNQSGPIYAVAEITEYGKDAPTATIDVLADDPNLQLQLDVPEAQTNALFTLTSDDTGFNGQLDLYYQGAYFGLDINAEMGETITLAIDFYAFDSENPLFSEVSTLTMGGQRTLPISGTDKQILSAETLVSGEDETATIGLTMDVLFNGLGGVISAVTEAVPESANLLKLLTDNAEADEAPAPAEVPAA